MINLLLIPMAVFLIFSIYLGVLFVRNYFIVKNSFSGMWIDFWFDMAKTITAIDKPIAYLIWLFISPVAIIFSVIYLFAI